jgi:hypothetical protein
MPFDPCHPHATPDYRQIVEKTLALFAIYTGATLSFFFKDFLFSKQNLAAYHGLDWLSYWGTWCSLAVVALLLRYIVGSAAHLNYAYVGKAAISGSNAAPTAAKSNNFCLLFIDLLFLVVFGILALLLTQSTDSVAILMRHAIYFIAVGFVWSVLALPRSTSPLIPGTWIAIDIVQIAGTLLVLYFIPGELAQAIVLGLAYLVFLFLDLYFIVRYMS